MLASHPAQLAGQLLGRLLGFDDSEIRSLMKQAGSPLPGHGSHLLLPITASLRPPGGPLLRTLEGHTHEVKAVALTADGRHAVSGSYDKTLRVWDLETGQTIRTLEGHTGRVTSLALTADGRHAVSGSWDNTLRVWDLLSGECLASFTAEQKICS